MVFQKCPIEFILKFRNQILWVMITRTGCTKRCQMSQMASWLSVPSSILCLRWHEHTPLELTFKKGRGVWQVSNDSWTVFSTPSPSDHPNKTQQRELTPFCLALPQLCLLAGLRLPRGNCRNPTAWIQKARTSLVKHTMFPNLGSKW